MDKDGKRNNISKQINKEVLITIVLYLIYFIWWYYFAYEYSSDNVEEYKYILGLPEWFFYSLRRSACDTRRARTLLQRHD